MRNERTNCKYENSNDFDCTKTLSSNFCFFCCFGKMASRYRSLSRSSLSLLKSAVNKPTLKSNPVPSHLSIRPSLTFSRSFPQLGALQSLLPLHSAVSSARLTSCLGIDSRSSRSLSQELGLSVPR